MSAQRWVDKALGFRGSTDYFHFLSEVGGEVNQRRNRGGEGIRGLQRKEKGEWKRETESCL